MEHIHLINELIKQMNKYNLPLWMTFITTKKLQFHINSSRNPEKIMEKIQVQFMKHIYINVVLPWLVVQHNICCV